MRSLIRFKAVEKSYHKEFVFPLQEKVFSGSANFQAVFALHPLSASGAYQP